MAGEELREKIGNLFTDLTAKLYGVTITKNGVNDSLFGNQDIINWERNQVYESKASIFSDHHKISPSQIEHYQNLLGDDFPILNKRLLIDPEAYYFFWQHKKRGVSKVPESDFIRNIVKNINRLLIFSFEVVEAGTRVWATTGQNSWGETYMFRSSERTALINYPEQELQRMSLNPDYYDITKESVERNHYAYKRNYLPQFTINSIIRKGMRGLERK